VGLRFFGEFAGIFRGFAGSLLFLVVFAVFLEGFVVILQHFECILVVVLGFSEFCVCFGVGIIYFLCAFWVVLVCFKTYFTVVRVLAYYAGFLRAFGFCFVGEWVFVDLCVFSILGLAVFWLFRRILCVGCVLGLV